MAGLRTPLLFFTGLLLIAQQAGWAAQADRAKIGLALSGGGARGAAHIGVLRVLEELRIPVDYIAGTSMGSIIGGLYASGMSPDDIESAMLAIDWDDVFIDEPPRQDQSFLNKRDDELYLIDARPGFNEGKIELPTGFVQGQKFDLILRRLTLPVSGIRDFDELAIPYRAIATAIGTGEEVVLESGDLAQAMRASMSVPGAFAATEIDGRLLVDGGIANNLPVDQVRAMGADIVIAVNISTPMRPPEEVNNVLTITGQLVSILTNRNTAKQLATLGTGDVLITPDLGDITSGDFDRVADAVPHGTAAAQAARESLQRLALSPEEYRRHLAARTGHRMSGPVISFVRIDNRSDVDDRMILERVHIPLGEPLDSDRLEADLGQVYGLDLFESVSYELVEEDAGTGVVIHARERSWGPGYLQFGANLSGNFKGDNQFNLGVVYLRTAINRLGGELRTGLQVGEEPALFVRLHQPLDYTSRFFLEPVAGIRRENFNIYSDGSKIAEYRLSTATVSLAAGREFGTWGEFRLGVSRGSGEAKVLVGDQTLPSFDYEDGEFFARLTIDELDNVNFPRRGLLARLEGQWNRTGLAADSSYDQATFNMLVARTWERNTFLFGAEAGLTYEGSADIQDLYRIGGFTRLSGLEVNELSGQHFGIVKLVYFRRFGEIRLLPIYLGGSLETGNAWQQTNDIDRDDLLTSGSVFLGLDSPIGPVYLGAGFTGGGRRSMFMTLGRNF